MALIRPQQIQPRLAEVGRLYKGQKKTDPKKPGEDLDYFRFEPSERTYDLPSPDGTQTLAHWLIERYQELGERPRSIPIRFINDDPKQIFHSCNEFWVTVNGRSSCIRRCDGEKQLLHLVENNGKKALSREPIPCAAEEEANSCPKGCKPTARLSFMIPALGYPGLIILTTHSINDILQIHGNLEIYSHMNLSQVPFRLCRTKKTIPYTDSNGSTRSMDRYICQVEIDPQFGTAVLQSQPNRYLAQLEGSDLIEAAVIEAESEPEPLETEQVPDWNTFLDLLSRAKNEKQVYMAQQWISDPKRWDRLDPSLKEQLNDVTHNTLARITS